MASFIVLNEQRERTCPSHWHAKQPHWHISEHFQLAWLMSIHCFFTAWVVQQRIEVHVAEVPAQWCIDSSGHGASKRSALQKLVGFAQLKRSKKNVQPCNSSTGKCQACYTPIFQQFPVQANNRCRMRCTHVWYFVLYLPYGKQSILKSLTSKFIIASSVFSCSTILPRSRILRQHDSAQGGLHAVSCHCKASAHIRLALQVPLSIECVCNLLPWAKLPSSSHWM